jgi:polysaccharide chain length determinant protein (PEP-CTERM system associated)
MQETENIFDIHYFWQIVLRRKWIIILPLFLTLPISIILCFTLPKMYSATTVILVTAPRIPESYIPSTVQISIRDRLNTIRQQIFSRTRLEKIITTRNLYYDLLQEMPMEEVVSIMKESIRLDVKGNASFSVSFQHQDPTITMDITNSLAQLFIEENLKNREKLARGTTQFLINELEKTNEILIEKEKQIILFRAENKGKMPEDQDVNISVINQTMREIDNLSSELSDAQTRKIILQQQLSAIDPIAPSESTYFDEGNYSSFSFNPIDDRLNSAREKLSDLRKNYTAKHPEIKAVQREIERLEKAVENDAESSEVLDEEEPKNMPNPIYQEIHFSITELENDIRDKKNQLIKLRTKLKSYQNKLEDSPHVAQEIKDITRDYSSYQELYNSLQGKILVAKQAEDLEKYQKSEQFEILDLAQLPEKPFQPRKKRILALGLLLGLFFGGGLTFLLEYQNNSFYLKKDIENYLQLPVLATIPMIDTKKEPRS